MSSIITTAELEQYTGETLDASRAEQVVEAVNAYIERATGRVWGEVVVTTETHDFASVIFLNNMDVVDVSELKLNDAVLEVPRYKWRDTGRVVLSTRESGFHYRYDEVEVTYTYGNLEVPADLKLAALSLASDFYTFAADGQTEVSAEGIGSLRYTYARGASTSTGATHFTTIDSFKKRSL